MSCFLLIEPSKDLSYIQFFFVTNFKFFHSEAAFALIYALVVYVFIYILRSKFFYCAMTIYIPFMLFKSNRV